MTRSPYAHFKKSAATTSDCEAMTPSATWSKDRVRRELFEYIEGHYNQSRLHSSLGYHSPVDFGD